MSYLIWPLLALSFGLILLVAEVFIPSGGMIGLLATGCLGVSLYLAFSVSTGLGLKFLLAEFFLVPSAFGLAMHLLPRTPVGRRILLRPPDLEEMDVSHSAQRLDHLIGQFGRALTPLRPSGSVDFDGRRLDAMAEEGLIPSGALIMAVRVQSGRLIVRAATQEAIEAQSSFEDQKPGF